MQMNFGEALPNAAQHFLVPVNLEVGMQPALHQHSGAAEFDGLADLVVNRVELEDVTLFRLRSLERPVKSAEGAVLRAEIGVVNVAVNYVSDHALGMQPAA